MDEEDEEEEEECTVILSITHDAGVLDVGHLEGRQEVPCHCGFRQ